MIYTYKNLLKTHLNLLTGASRRLGVAIFPVHFFDLYYSK